MITDEQMEKGFLPTWHPFIFRYPLQTAQRKKNDFIFSFNFSLQNGQLLYDQISWADAFVVVYSIDEKKSLIHARYLLETISILKGPRRSPVLLLGNKRDLEHARQIQVEDGQETSLRWSCHFYEVSVAESSVGVTLAFQSLIREAKAVIASKTCPVVRRKTSPSLTMSKVIGLVFGSKTSPTQNETNRKRNPKKRPSLSI